MLLRLKMNKFKKEKKIKIKSKNKTEIKHLIIYQRYFNQETAQLRLIKKQANKV